MSRRVLRWNVGQKSWSLRAWLWGDLIFFILHWAHFSSPALERKLFSISSDVSLPEIYQGFKQLGIIGLLISIALQTRELRYCAWILLFLYLICDDLLMIHEGLGHELASHMNLDPLFAFRLQDYGELSITLIFASILFTIIGVCYYHKPHPTPMNSEELALPANTSMIRQRRWRSFQHITQDLLKFIMLLGFFGVAIDMLHSALDLSRAFDRILDFLEDGGEMIVVSLMLGYLSIAAKKLAKTRTYFR